MAELEDALFGQDYTTSGKYPEVSQQAAGMALAGAILALVLFLAGGIILKLVVLGASMVIVKKREPWLRGAVRTLRTKSVVFAPAEPEAIDPREAELHATTNERMDALPPEMMVRGVWEFIEIRQSNWQDQTFKQSVLRGVELGWINDLFAIRAQKKPTWGQALHEPLDDGREVMGWISLDKVSSVELENAARYSGESTNPFGYHVPKSLQNKLFKERHPFASRNKLGGGYMDTSAQWVVFVFEKDGNRRPIFRTFDYDLALRLRTQVNNMFDAWRMEKTAKKAAPRDSADDYL